MYRIMVEHYYDASSGSVDVWGHSSFMEALKNYGDIVYACADDEVKCKEDVDYIYTDVSLYHDDVLLNSGRYFVGVRACS